MIWTALKYWWSGREALARDISSARLVALRRAGGKCELTGATGNLHGHHLFGVAWFPWWADKPWNIVIIHEDLHKRFHAWNGGTSVMCTPLGFWRWRNFSYSSRGWWALLSLVLSIVWIQSIHVA